MHGPAGRLLKVIKMLSYSEQKSNVQTNTVPLNIFQNVTSRTPAKSVRCTVETIAQLIKNRVRQVDRKEDAELVTFNAYANGAKSRGTSCIEQAYAVCGDWDHDFGQELFDRAMQELSDSGAQVIAYQTYRHTPESPRWRIFVFLDEPVAPDDYRACWEGLNAIFGGLLDDNAKDCARLNYWPSCPPGQTREVRTLNIEVA